MVTLFCVLSGISTKGLEVLVRSSGLWPDQVSTQSELEGLLVFNDFMLKVDDV